MYFSSIAHELRTPLNSILPLIESLKTYVSNPRGLLFIKIIKNSAIHLNNLINDALDISRIENNTFEISLEPFDIRATTKEVTEILEL
jgi:cell cycle sensor histidine kinase DivJ